MYLKHRETQSSQVGPITQLPKPKIRSMSQRLNLYTQLHHNKTPYEHWYPCTQQPKHTSIQPLMNHNCRPIYLIFLHVITIPSSFSISLWPSSSCSNVSCSILDLSVGSGSTSQQAFHSKDHQLLETEYERYVPLGNKTYNSFRNFFL